MYNMCREFVSLELMDMYGRITLGANFLGGNKDCINIPQISPIAKFQFSWFHMC